MAVYKVVSKNESKRSSNEPFAAIQYDGSYPRAKIILSMIGITNLDLPKGSPEDIYDIIEQLQDDDSNLRLPNIIPDIERKLYGKQKTTLKVNQWVVVEVNDEGWSEFVFYPTSGFEAKYSIKE